MYWVAIWLSVQPAQIRRRLSFCRKNDVDFVFASSKCLECSETADSFEFLLLAHAIKTNVGCASTSSKCTYVLNANSKGPGETAQMRRVVWAFVARICNKSQRRLRVYVYGMNVSCKGLLIGLWQDCLFSFGSIFCTGLALAWALRQGAWLLAYAILKQQRTRSV